MRPMGRRSPARNSARRELARSSRGVRSVQRWTMYSDKHDISSPSPSQPADPPPSRRGFAAMSPEQHRDIASRGGKKAHALGRAHRFTPEEAKAAGHKGGAKVSQDRAHMAAIGRRGGKVSPRVQDQSVESATDDRAASQPANGGAEAQPC